MWIIDTEDIDARAFEMLEEGRTYTAADLAENRRKALRQLVTEGGVKIEVARSADTGRHSVTVTGGTPAEKREAADLTFAALGKKRGDQAPWGVTRPHGAGLLFGEAR